MKNYEEAVNNILEMFKEQSFPRQLSISIIRKSKEEPEIPSDHWSILNRMLMVMVGRTLDARTYKQWQATERQVKKGAKSFPIIAPITRKVMDEDTGEEKIKLIGFRAMPVFPVELTDGKPLPSFDYTPADIHLSSQKLTKVIEKLGGTVRWAPIRGNALGFYRPSDNSITLSSPEFITLAHESVHFVHDTLENILTVDTKKAEIIAELGASVLCEIVGEHGYEQQSYTYIKSYCKDKDPKAVLSAINSVLTTVEKIINIIISNIDE